MSISPSPVLSVTIMVAGVVTLAAAVGTVVYHAEAVGVAGGVLAIALLGLVRWSR